MFEIIYYLQTLCRRAMIQTQSKTPPASNIVSKNDLSVKNNNKNCKNSLEIPSLVTAQVDGKNNPISSVKLLSDGLSE